MHRLQLCDPFGVGLKFLRASEQKCSAWWRRCA